MTRDCGHVRAPHDTEGPAGSDATVRENVLRAKVIGMDCASCAHTIEDGLRKLPGVQRASVDFTTETVEVAGAIARSEIENRLRQLGYRLAPASKQRDVPPTLPDRHAFLQFLLQQRHLRLALIGGLVALIAAFATGIGPHGASLTSRSSMPSPSIVASLGIVAHWVLIAVTAMVGWPILVKGLRALVFSRRVTIDLLMTLATLGAVLIGEVGEAATVVLLFTLGEALESFSAARARDSLRSLMALQPQVATVLRRAVGYNSGDDGSRHEGHVHDHDYDRDAHDHACDAHPHACDAHPHACDAHDHEHHQDAGSPFILEAGELVPGDVLLVRPGERVAADGLILSGSSSLNQSAVTGENLPVTRGPRDPVMAGTVNGEGALEIEVTRKSEDSTLARIAQLVERAQAERSPAERLVDRFARWYTPAVIGLAALTVAVPVLVFGQALLDAPDGSHGWLYRGLALLIVACPCALVISIPVTVVSSLTRLARLGVLVKGGEYLDVLAKVRAIAFDKTGTLTTGRPSVTAVQGRDCVHEPELSADCESCDDVIALAATVESSSEHPIAHAIMTTARARGLHSRYPSAERVAAVAGQGVTGEVHGRRIAVGSATLIGRQGALSSPEEFGDLHRSQQTVMTVARDTEIIGAIGVEDTVRAQSAAALEELRHTPTRVHTVMLTGDNARAAAVVAAKIGSVDEVRAQLLPADKLAAIHELRKDHGPVVMIGDGINDAPALASADVGVAMGSGGTAQAMETADVVLMQDDLRRLPMMLRIARRNRSIVKENIALSLGLKLAFVALVIPGWATLWLAVAADVGTTLLVTLNGMRMLRAR